MCLMVVRLVLFIECCDFFIIIFIICFNVYNLFLILYYLCFFRFISMIINFEGFFLLGYVFLVVVVGEFLVLI